MHCRRSEELKAFKERICQRDCLSEQDYRLIEVMITAVETLTEAMENKRASITRLARYLFGAPTETAEIVPANGVLSATLRDARRDAG